MPSRLSAARRCRPGGIGCSFCSAAVCSWSQQYSGQNGQMIGSAPQPSVAGHPALLHLHIRRDKDVIDSPEREPARPGRRRAAPAYVQEPFSDQPPWRRAAGRVEISAQNHRWNTRRRSQPPRCDQLARLKEPFGPIQAQMRVYPLHIDVPHLDADPKRTPSFHGFSLPDEELAGLNHPHGKPAQHRIAVRTSVSVERRVKIVMHTQALGDAPRLILDSGSGKPGVNLLKCDQIGPESRYVPCGPSAGVTVSRLPAAAHVVGHDH